MSAAAETVRTWIALRPVTDPSRNDALTALARLEAVREAAAGLIADPMRDKAHWTRLRAALAACEAAAL